MNLYKHTSLLICISTLTLLPELYSGTRNIMTTLADLCPDTEAADMLGNNLLQPNLIQLAKSVTTDGEVAGEGDTSQVFFYRAFDNDSQQSQHYEAAKILMVGEDQNKMLQKAEQNLLINEVQTQIALNKLDSENLYFPQLYSCAEATKEFKSALTGNNVNENFIKAPPGKLPFVMSMEVLETPLSYINIEVMNHKQPPISIDQRVQMAINLFHGQVLMNQHFLNCDIYDKNIGLKVLDEAMSLDVTNKGLRVIDYMGAYYQAKLMDFGASISKENNPNPTCRQARMGFAPPEFFEVGSTHEKFDDYSMGMTLIDQELRSGYSDPLSRVFEVIDSVKFHNMYHPQQKVDIFNQSQKGFLKAHDLIKDLTKIMENPDFTQKIKEDVVLRLPNAEELAMNGASMNLSWQKDDPSEFMYNSVELFEALVLTTLNYYSQSESFVYEFKQRKANLEKRSTQIQTKITQNQQTDPNKANQFNNMLTLNQNAIKILEAEIELKKIVFSVLLNLIKPKAHRNSAENTLNKLLLLLKNYKMTNQPLLLQNEQVKLVTLKKKAQTLDQARQKAVAVYEHGRPQRQPTLYNTGKSQYSRRRLVLI